MTAGPSGTTPSTSTARGAYTVSRDLGDLIRHRLGDPSPGRRGCPSRPSARGRRGGPLKTWLYSSIAVHKAEALRR